MRASLLLLMVLASLVSCVARRPFQVLRGHPDDLLRWPDSVETPFPEVLQHYNGFEPGQSWVELRPRMELRVENAYYQEGMPKHGLAGFLGTEVAHYEVRPKGGLRLLSFLAMKNRPQDQRPVQKLIVPSQQHRRFYRFYYEVFFKGKAEAQGSVLLGAKSRRELERLGTQLARDPSSICGEQSGQCTVFPEACSVSLEMEIVVNGVPRVVTWGTMLAGVAGHPLGYRSIWHCGAYIGGGLLQWRSIPAIRWRFVYRCCRAIISSGINLDLHHDYDKTFLPCGGSLELASGYNGFGANERS